MEPIPGAISIAFGKYRQSAVRQEKSKTKIVNYLSIKNEKIRK